MTFKRDLKKLIRSMQSLTNGQAAITVNEQNFCQFKLIVVPNDGPYLNGKFEFEISYDDPSDYPACPPQVLCITPIYHPNIDSEDPSGTNVCLSLFDEWESENTLEDVVQGLLFLFYNPNLEDPLNPLFDGSGGTDDFEGNVKKSLEGEEIDGTEFERNQVGDDASQHLLESSDVSLLGEDSDDNDDQGTNSDINPTSNGAGVSVENDSQSNVTEETVTVTNAANLVDQKEEAVVEKTVDKELESRTVPCKNLENASELETVACPSHEQKKLNYHFTLNLALRTATAVLTYMGFLNCYQTVSDKIR